MNKSNERRSYTARFGSPLLKRMRIAALEAGRPLNQILNDLLEREFPAPEEPVRKARKRSAEVERAA